MSDDTQERAEQIFLEALELPPPQRAPFVDRQCGGDTNLRALVDSFLAADQAADSANFLESHFLAGATLASNSPPAHLQASGEPELNREPSREDRAFGFSLDTSRGDLARS